MPGTTLSHGFFSPENRALARVWTLALVLSLVANLIPWRGWPVTFETVLLAVRLLSCASVVLLPFAWQLVRWGRPSESRLRVGHRRRLSRESGLKGRASW